MQDKIKKAQKNFKNSEQELINLHQENINLYKENINLYKENINFEQTNIKLNKKDLNNDSFIKQQKENTQQINSLKEAFKHYSNFNSLFLVLISVSLTTIVSICINAANLKAFDDWTQVLAMIGCIFGGLMVSFIICYLLMSLISKKFKSMI